MFSFIFFNKNILESDHFLSDEMRWPRKNVIFLSRAILSPKIISRRASPHSPCWLGLCILSQHKVLGEVISYWIFFFFLQKMTETAHRESNQVSRVKQWYHKRKYGLLKVIKKNAGLHLCPLQQRNIQTHQWKLTLPIVEKTWREIWEPWIMSLRNFDLLSGSGNSWDLSVCLSPSWYPHPWKRDENICNNWS